MLKSCKMENKIFGILIVLCVHQCWSSPDLLRKMNTLEQLVSQENLRIKSDLIELRHLISTMDVKKTPDSENSLDKAEIVSKLKDMEAEIKNFIKEQKSKSAAVSKAISDEKAVSRKLLNVVKELATSNAKSVQEIEEAISLNEAVRDEFTKEMDEFKTSMEAKIDAVRNLTELMDERIVNMDGTLIIQGVPKKPPCPDGWFRNTDNCYLFNKQEKLNWYGASIRCHDFGGKLVELETESEMKYIVDKIENENNVWIGASDDDIEGSWVWSSSQKAVDVVTWQSGQPNNLGGNQNCMEIGLSKMNDENCFEENLYVCEMPVSH